MRPIRMNTLMLLVVIAAMSLALVMQSRQLVEKEKTIRLLKLEQELLNEQLDKRKIRHQETINAQEKLIQSLLTKGTVGAGH